MAEAENKRSEIIMLFDVDGTLTPSRLEAEAWVRPWLASLREKVTIGFVGGSDLPKQKEQLGEDVQDMFDYCFAENGLVAFKGKDKLSEHSFKAEMDAVQLKKLINFILMYVAQLDIPVKRGTFIEFRSGMLNVSPIGRNCSQDERMAFYAYDQEHKVREKMINVIKAEFSHLKMTYSIGGQISFDVFPTGWDKTYCLKFLEKYNFKEIHFFGDKTYKGGNDHEIFECKDTIGHTVTSPNDTRAQVAEVLKGHGITLKEAAI